MSLSGRSRSPKLIAAALILLAGLRFRALATPQNSEGSPNGTGGLTVAVRKPRIHVAPIQIDVNMVLLNVTVTDPYNRVVTGLELDNFVVFDEKVEQHIASFSSEDVPISVGLIFDSSGSMSAKIQKSEEAVLQFFKTSNPQDEFMLINFSNGPTLVSGFTSRFENLQNSLLFVKPEFVN